VEQRQALLADLVLDLGSEMKDQQNDSPFLIYSDTGRMDDRYWTESSNSEPRKISKFRTLFLKYTPERVYIPQRPHLVEYKIKGDTYRIEIHAIPPNQSD
jgi:hypothetical protein